MSEPAICSVSIEWLCEHVCVVRLHPHPRGRYGDPYTWSMTVVRNTQDGTIARCKAVIGAIAPSALRLVDKALARHGFRQRAYHRFQDGHVRKVVIRKIRP